MKKSYYMYSSWYFLMYFALGGFFPLFSQLLTSFKLEGSILGIIFSVGSFATIISQPFWGFVNDKLKKPKQVVSFLLISSSIMIFCFFFTRGASVVGLVYLIFMFFNDIYFLIKLFINRKFESCREFILKSIIYLLLKIKKIFQIFE